MDNTTIQQQIAGRVNEAMKLSGFNPSSLAEATGISRSNLNRMLKCQRQFGTIDLVVIGHYLNTDLEDFISGVQVAA